MKQTPHGTTLKAMNAQAEYNRWTNYATWRIALEYFGTYEPEEEVTAEYLRELVEEHIIEQGYGICLDYALAFIREVNWDEIADKLKDE